MRASAPYLARQLSENDSHETGAVTLAKRVRVRG